jgi:nanoRNase/pAp phosphatase (c-di-AMP/oligoRNAs hydrolase)
MSENDEKCIEPDCPYFNSFKKLIKDKSPKKIAIFTHSCPDPDAIGSIMAFTWMISKLDPNIECNGFYDGPVSHPQNIALVNLLDPNLRPVVEFIQAEYDFFVVVDAVPANAGLGGNTISFDLCIDHHKEIPNGGFKGLFLNLKAGSCCATIYNLIEKLGYEFADDNDHDSKVATAIMVGISTDTESLMSDDATNYEFTAWQSLFEFRNPAILKRIVNFGRPKYWIEHKANAAKNALVEDGIAVVGIGAITAYHRDMIADMADEMVGWEDVNTAVAFAIIDGERIEGSVRSRNASVMVPNLCKEFAGKYGAGGGKLSKGAYRYSLGGTAFDDEDNDEIKKKTWELLNEKETKRLFRIIKK